MIVYCVFEMCLGPCRFTLSLLAWYVCVQCVCLLSSLWVVHVCLFPCLHQCLTMCCLFALVYIYCSVHGCKADHSREQSVFIEFFKSCLKTLLLCAHSIFLFPAPSLSFNPLSQLKDNHQNIKLAVKLQQTTEQKQHLALYSSIASAAVKIPLSPQTIHSEW